MENSELDKNEARRAKRREWYAKNKAKINKKMRARYAANSEYFYAYRQKTKARKKLYNKQYHVSHRLRIKKVRQAWRSTLRGYFIQKLGGARRRNKDFDLTYTELETIYHKQNGKCALTGRKLCLLRRQSLDSLSIDRKNPHKGYTKNNVRLVTWQANGARHSGTDAQLLGFCRDVLKHHSKKPK